MQVQRHTRESSDVSAMNTDYDMVDIKPKQITPEPSFTIHSVLSAAYAAEYNSQLSRL